MFPWGIVELAYILFLTACPGAKNKLLTFITSINTVMIQYGIN